VAELTQIANGFLGKQFLTMTDEASAILVSRPCDPIHYPRTKRHRGFAFLFGGVVVAWAQGRPKSPALPRPDSSHVLAFLYGNEEHLP
jgi:hypothetical protein